MISFIILPIFVNSPAWAKCGDAETSIINCEDPGNDKDIKKSAIWQLLILVINILTGGVAIAALGGLVYASILYTSSGGNPETRKKSLGIITNVVIGIISFALMWALLNFIIPGGMSL